MNTPIVNAKLTDLPEPIRTLFDPTVFLPEGVQFLPRSTDRVADGCSGVLVGGIYFLGGVFGSIVLTAYVFKPGSDLYRPGEFWGISLVYVVFLAILLNFARLGYGQFHLFLDTCAAVRERRAGRLRQGLFLTGEWLILRMATDRASAIPRESVISASVSAGFKFTIDVVVQFRQANGKTGYLSWERLKLENKSAERTCERIESWRNDLARITEA